MDCKTDKQKELTLDALIENLEHKYSNIAATPDKIELISEPTPERVCAGIKGGSSARNKVNNSLEPDMFFKYNGVWYKWCTNCRQYHPVMCFNRHRGYEKHENFHNVCFVTTRIMNLTNNRLKPMSVDDILRRWSQLKEDVMKPVNHYVGETAFRKRTSDKQKRTSKVVIAEIRQGLDTSVGDLADNLHSLYENTSAVADTTGTGTAPVLKPVTENVVPVEQTELHNTTDDAILLTFGAAVYNKVIRLMTKRAQSGQGISPEDFRKLATSILAQASVANRYLSLRQQAQILNTASKAKSDKLLKVKQSK